MADVCSAKIVREWEICVGDDDPVIPQASKMIAPLADRHVQSRSGRAKRESSAVVSPLGNPVIIVDDQYIEVMCRSDDHVGHVLDQSRPNQGVMGSGQAKFAVTQRTQWNQHRSATTIQLRNAHGTSLGFAL